MAAAVCDTTPARGAMNQHAMERHAPCFIHSFMFKKPMYYFAIPSVESRLVSCTSGVHELRPNSIVWFDKLSTVYESYDKSTLKCLARAWGMEAG